MSASPRTSPMQAHENAEAECTPGTSGGQALVIFVLGGPGSGKGTQCARLAQEYGFKHFSVGDMLREEQDRAASEIADTIRFCINEGLTIPGDITTRLLERAMAAAIEENGVRKFLIDGFPRRLDQAITFEARIARCRFTLFLECSEDIMRERSLLRGRQIGRSDDNEETIKKRCETFKEATMPVIEDFEKQGRLVVVDSSHDPDTVHRLIMARFSERGIET